MKYRYTSFFPPEKTLKWVKRPLIKTEIFGPKESRTFDALIDSGADCSLFNVEIAELLEIDLSRAKQRKFTGISGTLTGYYLPEVEIKVDGMERSIKIPVCFVQSPTVGLLLGEEGFFDSYRIKFEKDHDTFEITSVKS
jgi:hypothetical protein